MKNDVLQKRRHHFERQRSQMYLFVDTPDFLLETYINWLLVIDGDLFFLVYFVFVSGLISKIETWHQSSYLTLRQKLPSGEL